MYGLTSHHYWIPEASQCAHLWQNHSGAVPGLDVQSEILLNYLTSDVALNFYPPYVRLQTLILMRCKPFIPSP